MGKFDLLYKSYTKIEIGLKKKEKTKYFIFYDEYVYMEPKANIMVIDDIQRTYTLDLIPKIRWAKKNPGEQGKRTKQHLENCFTNRKTITNCKISVESNYNVGCLYKIEITQENNQQPSKFLISFTALGKIKHPRLCRIT
jgi:hypothetical protein